MSLSSLWLWGSAIALIVCYVWLAVETARANGSLGSIPVTRRLIQIGAWSWAAFHAAILFAPNLGSFVQRVTITRSIQFVLIIGMIGLIHMNRELRLALRAALDGR